ncbi:MAG TPA: glycosyltransferase family 4 protein [Acidimicrobiia bacterium]|nr:glycosyltransferase family 4 protein [Acidimicrobiia bacterium]
MRVLYVIEALGEGGTEMSLAQLLPGLRDVGVEPIVVALKSRGAEGVEHSLRADNFDIRVLEPGNLLAQARQLRTIIGAEDPALVHTMLWRANQVARLANLRRVTLLTSLVNESYGAARLADPHVRRRSLRLAQAVDVTTAHLLTHAFHAVSQSVKDAEIRGQRLAAARITVVPRGRDDGRLGAPSQERTQQQRRAAGIADDALVLVNVARQEYQKGHRHLVAAMHAVVERQANAQLFVAGRSGTETTALEQLLATTNTGANVHFLGHVPAVGDFLATGDVFVFPSLYEGMPGAVIEAMAMALPIVASDIPSVREVVEPGVNALLVDPSDHRALADALLTLLADPARRRAFGAESRRIFESRFRLDASVRAMYALYERLTG